MNYDEAAIVTILSDVTPTERRRRLVDLAQRGAAAVGASCPDCGAGEPEDNGPGCGERSYLCPDCGHGWDVEAMIFDEEDDWMD